MSVRRLLREIDSTELTEWMAFSRIEPIGAARLDYLFALLIVAIRRAWMEGKDAGSLADWLPSWTEARPEHDVPQTAEDLHDHLRS